MKKVQVRDRCIYCNGQSYIFERERWCLQGDGDQKYKPCPYCNGTGEIATWVDLEDFAELLDQATSVGPEYISPEREPITDFQDSLESSGLP